MQFTKEQTKQIRKWLASNNFQVGCRLGKIFLYEPNDNYIMVQRDYDSDFDIDFTHCLRKLGLKHNFDCTTLSILHELGHSQTMFDFTPKEWEKDDKYKTHLINTIHDQHKLNVKYWKSATELSANKWLVKYVNKHPKQVKKLENIVSQSLW